MADFNCHLFAKAFLKDRLTVHWNGSFWRYDGKAYRPKTAEELQHEFRTWLPDQGIDPTTGKVTNLVGQSAALTHRPTDSLSIPSWLVAADRPDPCSIINFRNGLLNVATGAIGPHNPELFTSTSLPFNYDPDAACPRWAKFLGEVLEDEDQIELLQTWFGYNLTLDTSYQRFMLLHGPQGAGKGVCMRVMLAMLGGTENVCAASLQGLSDSFGLSGLIGKQAALVTEVELGRDSNALVHVIKAVTGNDPVCINRKYQQPYTGSLPVRFTIAANKVPKLPDASNALAARMLSLVFPNSYRGTPKEKPYLERELLEELPGILNWSLMGLRLLRERGQFVQAERGKEEIQDFRELAAPQLGFADDYLIFEPGAWTSTDDLFTCWKHYAYEGNYGQYSRKAAAMALKAAFPKLKRLQKRINGNQKWGYMGVDVTTLGRRVIASVAKLSPL